MRLSVDQVKQAILHDDRHVREAAVYYFAQSFSPDPSITPLAIQAIEQYGWRDAFEIYSFLRELAQSDETVRWLIGQIRTHGQPDEQYGFVHAIRSALVYANPGLLQQHAAEIGGLDELDEQAKDEICQRVQFASQPPEELWQQVQDFCDRSDRLDKVPDDLKRAEDLVEALGRHHEFSAPKVQAILNGTPSDNWMELCAVRLAGEIRLQEAIPSIVVLFHEPDDWIFEDGHRALVKIGGDRVVEELTKAYPAGASDFRSAAANILETIHSDLSVQTCLRFFETEQDHHTRCSLIQSVLMSFATEGIEPARQFILTTPLDPEVIEVRHGLLTACKALGESFPEFKAWTQDAKNDIEFRKRWYRTMLPDLDEFELDEEESDEPPPDTIIRQAHVGRNDPCPCGSGKKFKKCCLNKWSAAI